MMDFCAWMSQAMQTWRRDPELVGPRPYIKVLDGIRSAVKIETVSEPEAAAWRLSGLTVDLLAVEPGGLVTAWAGEVEP